jgi:hypothetical protein
MKKTHSMAQPQTKTWMRVEVAVGWTRPMAHQMPAPLTAPKTSTTSTKKREWRFR